MIIMKVIPNANVAPLALSTLLSNIIKTMQQ
jgi:hypothetical protein